jgi:hypothetical protein
VTVTINGHKDAYKISVRNPSKIILGRPTKTGTHLMTNN